MVELGERPLLTGEAFATDRGYPRIAKYLDRNQAAQVGALGQEDDTHSAFPEHFLDCVPAKILTSRERARFPIGQHLVCNLGHAPVEQRCTTCILFQHGRNIREKRAVLATGNFEKVSLRALRQVGRVVEQGLDPFPAMAIHESPSENEKSKS